MTPDTVTRERLETLAQAGSPEGLDERDLVALMTDLRDCAGALPELRARVRTTAAKADSTRPSILGRVVAYLKGTTWRGRALALAPACAIALLVAVVAVGISGAGGGGGDDTATVERGATTVPALSEEAAPPAGAAPAADDQTALPPSPAQSATVPSAVPVPPGSIPPGSDAGRPQDVQTRTVVRVPDVGDLSSAGATAMRRVRGLGGYTVDAAYSVPNGERGRADLTFRVPVARTEDALTAFAELGAVSSQTARIADLGERLDEAERRAGLLRDEIADLRAQVRRTPDDRALRAKIRGLRDELRALIAGTEQVRAEARLATLALTLTTQAAPPAPAAAPGRFEDAARDAGGALSVTFSAILRVGLVLLPFIVLLVAGLIGWRQLRRRADRRLLETG